MEMQHGLCDIGTEFLNLVCKGSSDLRVKLALREWRNLTRRLVILRGCNREAL